MRNLVVIIAFCILAACRTGGSGTGPSSGFCVPGDSGPVPPVIVTPDKAGRPGTLRVTVRDARTDAAIVDAVVSFQPSGRGTPTNSEGEARLDSMPTGTRVLTMRRVGYRTRVDTLGVAPETAEHVIARLQHAPYCVEKVVQVRQVPPAT